MSLILRRFAAAWLLERVSSGEQRRRWCEEENYRCIYTGEQAKLKVFSQLIDWKWVKVGTTTRKCWHVAGQLQLNSSWLLVFLPKKLNEYFFFFAHMLSWHQAGVFFSCMFCANVTKKERFCNQINWSLLIFGKIKVWGLACISQCRWPTSARQRAVTLRFSATNVKLDGNIATSIHLHPLNKVRSPEPIFPFTGWEAH